MACNFVECLTMLNKNNRGLSLMMLIALVVGNTIGSGIFLLPSSLADFGSISLLAWVFTGLGSLFLAFMFIDLNRMLPKIGGPYAYCREGLGDCVGFLIAYNYWIGVWVANAAVAVALVGYLGIIWPSLNEHSPAYSSTLAFLIEAGSVWLFTFINIVGVRTAGIIQILTTILKMLPLLAICFLGIFKVHVSHFVHLANNSGEGSFPAFLSAATLTLWAFIGLESATIPADEVNKASDIPKATLLGTLIVLAFYVFSTIVIMGLIPPEELRNSQAPFADAANIVFGFKAELLVTLSAIVSCLGALNGWILIQAHIPLAAAKDNLFPKLFARLGRFHTPAVGQVITSMLVTALLALTLNSSLVKQFTFIVLLSTLAFLIPYFVSAVSELILLRENRLAWPKTKIIKSIIVSILAGLYAFWAIAGAGKEVVFYGSLLLFSGFPVYAWIKWR